MTNTHTFCAHLRVTFHGPAFTPQTEPLLVIPDLKNKQKKLSPNPQNKWLLWDSVWNNIGKIFNVSVSEVFAVHAPYSVIVNVFGEREKYL